MATLDELERTFRADPALADLPAIRAQVARATYGDAFMGELHRDYEALRAAGTLVVRDDDTSGGSESDRHG